MIRYRHVLKTYLRVTCVADGQSFWLTKAEVTQYPEFVKKRTTLRARLRWLRLRLHVATRETADSLFDRAI